MNGFKRLNLSSIDRAVTFNITLTRGEKGIYIAYRGEENEGYEDFFNDFSDFFCRLHIHYKNRITNPQPTEEIIDILNEYASELIEYQIVFSDFFCSQSVKITKEVALYEKYIETQKKLCSPKVFSKPKVYTEKQIVLILEYTNLLKTIKNLDIQSEQEAQLISAITGMHFDNARKYLRNRHKPVEKGAETKTRANLETVKQFLVENKFPCCIVNKVQEDLDSIRKG